MSFDIRKPEVLEPDANATSQQDPIEWLKQNRHLFAGFRTGQVIEKIAGDFKPAAVDNLSEQAREEANREAKIELDKPVKEPIANTNLKAPEPVDFDSLPVAKKEAILQSIKDSTAKLTKQAVQPSIQSQQQLPPPTQEKPRKLNEGLPDDIKLDFDIIDFMNKDREELQKAAQEKEAAKNSPSSTTNATTAGGLPEKANCQHCGWDLKKDEPEQATDLDKLNFVQSVLGQIPFKKQYELLGGRMLVTFRSLSSEESDMTFTQVAWDAGRGDILEEGQYFRTLTDYRMVLSLSSIKTADGVSHNLPDSVHSWNTDKVPAKATKLIHIVPWVYSNILKADSLRRAVAACHYRFQRLLENMEAHIDDSDFWSAIEKQS